MSNRMSYYKKHRESLIEEANFQSKHFPPSPLIIWTNRLRCSSKENVSHWFMTCLLTLLTNWINVVFVVLCFSYFPFFLFEDGYFIFLFSSVFDPLKIKMKHLTLKESWMTVLSWAIEYPKMVNSTTMKNHSTWMR